MTNKKRLWAKRFLCVFLSVVMVIGLVPMMAFAVENKDSITVDNDVKLYASGKYRYYDCVTKKTSVTEPESGSYVHFIPDFSNGSVNVLELCNYEGGYISYESSNTHGLQINLIGENTITHEKDGKSKGILSGKDLYIFGATSGAKLNINVKSTSTKSSDNALGIFMIKSELTIGGYAKVNINVEGEASVIGIHCSKTNIISSPEKGVTLQGNASLNINCVVRSKEFHGSTSCINSETLKINTKGDFTATIGPNSEELDTDNYSLYVLSTTIDFVRNMKVKGTRDSSTRNDGSIRYFDSSSDGNVRFDENKLAYNCGTDNVAEWRGIAGEKPLTLTVKGGRIKQTGKSTGRYFERDKVEIEAETDYLPSYEGSTFRRWYLVTDTGKKVAFSEGKTSTCYFYMCDGDGKDCTVWADINVYKNAFSHIPSKNTTRIDFYPANTTENSDIRLFQSHLVKSGGNADNPDDIAVDSTVYAGSSFNKTQLPEGSYQIASKMTPVVGTDDPWYYSEPFAVFYDTFVVQPM